MPSRNQLAHHKTLHLCSVEIPTFPIDVACVLSPTNSPENPKKCLSVRLSSTPCRSSSQLPIRTPDLTHQWHSQSNRKPHTDHTLIHARNSQGLRLYTLPVFVSVMAQSHSSAASSRPVQNVHGSSSSNQHSQHAYKCGSG